VRDYVARRYRVSPVALLPVLAAAEDSARSVGIDPLLVVAVIAVESSFNPFAESHMGAQGLMQVIPRFHMDKIGDEAGEDALFDPMLNVRVGTLVIDEGLRRYGSMQAALQYYGGARSDATAAYYRRVMAVKQRLASAAGRKAMPAVTVAVSDA
jgi:soluble lytic murein transglycosylase-like protein